MFLINAGQYKIIEGILGFYLSWWMFVKSLMLFPSNIKSFNRKIVVERLFIPPLQGHRLAVMVKL